MQITPGPSGPTTLDGSPNDYAIATGNGVTYLRRHGGPLKRVSATESVCFRELSFEIVGGQFAPLLSVGGASDPDRFSEGWNAAVSAMAVPASGPATGGAVYLGVLKMPSSPTAPKRAKEVRAIASGRREALP